MKPGNAAGMLIAAIMLSSFSSAFAQCAGCGADYNKADRAATAREAERQRLDRVDPPIRKDPLGNALIGGAVTGVVTQSAAAAARAVITGTVTGALIERGKDATRRR